MGTQHAGIIRGLSIATTVIAALCTMILLVVLAAFGLGGVVLSNPDMRDQASYELDVDPEDVQSLEDLGIPAGDDAAFADFVLGAGGALAGAEVVCHVVALIAGILGICNARRPEKLTMLLVWTIIAALASVVARNFILVILLVITGVLIFMDRRAASLSGGQTA